MSMPPIPFFCPETGVPLVALGNWLLSSDGASRYFIKDGIPDFTGGAEEGPEDACWSAFYDRLAPFFDWSERVLGRLITGVDIPNGRAKLAALIPAEAGEAVLEVSPGPGIYQPALASRLGRGGRIVALDLSRGMLEQCRHNCAAQVPRPQLVQANGARLPFDAGRFDGLFHFGGVNLFSEPARALDEFARVVKPGGWVVVGDEQFSPAWQARRDWRTGLLSRMNPGYLRPPPALPAALECVASHEVFGGLGYLKVCRVCGH